MPEKTKEDFFVENGRRWFRSGDIAQLEPEGTKKYRENTFSFTFLACKNFAFFFQQEFLDLAVDTTRYLTYKFRM